MAKTVEEVEILAWVGEDELGSGEVGMKQIATSKGITNLAAVSPGNWVQHDHVFKTMQAQADQYGKTLYLCRYKLEKIEKVIEPGKEKN